jgi:hypothetical protein
MAAVARPDALPTSAPAGLVVHGPEETLRDFCFQEDGRLWFVAPQGARFELVTSTSDAGVANPGDGAFHPFDEAVVRAALATVRYRVQGLSAHVFLLPYPRRLGHASAAAHQLIMLSPGVRPLAEGQQHAAAVHELGHVIQYALMPDPAVELWSRYRGLRGITDASRYHAGAAHADRPHEIFAEDFRALFGGPLATYSGTIENASLTPPAAVEGLEAFLASLAEDATAGADGLRAFPNPTGGPSSFRRRGGDAEPLDLFDVTGRRLASLWPTPLAGGWQWRWDGRDERGVAAAPGVVFARPRWGHGAVRITVR